MMSKCHVIINVFSDDYEEQISEVYQLFRGLPKTMQQGNTFIIGSEKMDGDGKQRLAEMAPTKSVIFVLLERFDMESIIDKIAETIDSQDIYICGSNWFGQEMSVRLGGRSGGSSMIGCQEVQILKDSYLLKKRVYGNHMTGSFQGRKYPLCISALRGMQGELPEHQMDKKKIHSLHLSPKKHSPIYHTEFQAKEQETTLESSSFVLVGGRGIKNREGVEELARIGNTIHADYGVTRPVVMNAWAPMNRLVGVSGAMIKPQICITAGLSGAAALYAGIEKSQLIVAINQDENAPITKKADVVIVDDCREILQELEALIERENSNEQ